MKDYAIEYGGYLQSKVKDAAPSAWISVCVRLNFCIFVILFGNFILYIYFVFFIRDFMGFCLGFVAWIV